MFGTLRFCLAMLVALSHIGVTVFGHNPGVSAVVVFYLLAGYITCALVDGRNLSALGFLYERAIRLYPSYWVCVILSLLVWHFCNPTTSFLSRSPSLTDWVANLTIVPLNFFMWTGQDSFTLVPPAWSLGLELQLYLLAPFLFRAPRGILIFFAYSSLLIYLIACFGLIDTDIWGYRLLPGVLFIFLTGRALRLGEVLLPLIVWLMACVLLITYVLKSENIYRFNIETATGLALGMPLVLLLSKIRRRVWDEFLANLSYPFFLLHFCFFWIFEKFTVPIWRLTERPIIMAKCFALIFVMSVIINFCIQLPLDHRRRRIIYQKQKTIKFSHPEDSGGA